MTFLRKYALARLCPLLTLSYSLSAQSLEKSLSRLTQAKSDTARSNALVDLGSLGRTDNFPVCSPNASAPIKRALIKALEKENEVIYSAAVGSLSETETEYFANLIGCVAALRDPLALPGLIGAIDTGGGAVDGIIALGDAAVPRVVQVLRAKTESVGRRHAAVRILGRLASRPRAQPLSQASLAMIRATLLATLRDEDYYMRAVAVRSLTRFPDAEVRNAVEALAKSDTATRVESGKRVYPVRAAALDWLKHDSLKARKGLQ
jgi:HEAT repeat protein